jgi:putative pyruvate formate lyase activating enzyme
MRKPIYFKNYENGNLIKIKDDLYKNLKKCNLCPVNCGIDRTANKGVCGAEDKVKISEYVLYPGEEPPLTGKTGAGGVFFSGCSMKCVYCQNFRFSQEGFGRNVSVEELSEIYMKIQNEKKAVNLDLVTATPYLPFIVDALILAIEKGFNLPIVWNTSSFEKPEIIEILGNFIDIYLPDIRYTSNIIAKKFSFISNYWDTCKKALKEMYNQIGDDYILNEENILQRGIIIRILVLPNHTFLAKEALTYIKYDLSEKIHVSLMDQYVPVYKARDIEKLSRFLNKKEYDDVVKHMVDLELENGWIQEHKLKEE